jgi:hypothetical protein
MKSRLITMLKKGRVLDWAEDRTGVYSLRNVNKLPKLRRAPRVAPVTTGLPEPAPQPSLFEEAKAPETTPPVQAADRTDRTDPTDRTDLAKLAAPPPKLGGATPESCAVVPKPTTDGGQGTASPTGKNSKESQGSTESRPPAPALTKVGFFQSTKMKIKAFFAASVGFVPNSFARLRGKLRSASGDSRPRAQAELALEKVKVIRNDLSDADLVVVAVQARPEDPCAAKAEGREAAGNPWARVAARWIKLTGPAEEASLAAAAPPTPPEQRAEMARTQPLNPC